MSAERIPLDPVGELILCYGSVMRESSDWRAHRRAVNLLESLGLDPEKVNFYDEVTWDVFVVRSFGYDAEVAS
jgi:hypothetical protein